MVTLIKPHRLQAGDTVAVVTPSWGGPASFPHRYEAGKQQAETVFGLKLVEMSHTLASAEYLANHPEARANDLMAAFADPHIAGIIASIGGDDCIRLLPYLDLDVIRRNPKIFIGFSDTTALHFACMAAGMSSFYGPSIMAGFAENDGMHEYTINALRNALFAPKSLGLIPNNIEGWTAEHLDWGQPELQTQKRVLQPSDAPKVLQGSGSVTGHLVGGCAEVIEMTKGTAWWPSYEQWHGAILFYETSEDAPSPQYIRYWLRNFAAQGILKVLSGILIARPDPRGDAAYRENVETAFIECLSEAGLHNLPVLSGLDFGHTQPMLTLPYGASATINCDACSLTINEAGVI